MTVFWGASKGSRSDDARCRNIFLSNRCGAYMKTIYKSEKGKEEILKLYDSQLSRLKAPWKEVYVDTSFGKTHIIILKRDCHERTGYWYFDVF